MSLSREEVRKIAQLARLELADDELDAQARNFNALLAQFEKLLELDVAGVEPTSHSIPLHNVLRDDAARPCLPRDEVLSNAPEARSGYFIVPRILET